MKKLSSILITVSSLVLLTNCATILKDKNQIVNFNTSNGENGKIRIKGAVHKIPGQVSVERNKENLRVFAASDNCTPLTVESTVEPVFFVNIISGGTFGSTTDFASGHMWKYQDTVTVNCK